MPRANRVKHSTACPDLLAWIPGFARRMCFREAAAHHVAGRDRDRQERKRPPIDGGGREGGQKQRNPRGEGEHELTCEEERPRLDQTAPARPGGRMMPRRALPALVFPVFLDL